VLLNTALGIAVERPAGYEYVLDTAITSNKPDISGNTISYSLDLVFRKRPENYWMFYNKLDNTLVVDLYGGHVRPIRIALPSTTPFRKVEIENLTTRMTLSGKQAHVKITLGPDWNYEAESADSTTVHINIWKAAKIQDTQITQKRSQYFYAYIAAAVAAAWAVLGIVLAIHKNV
jgi:hypothetical protein